MPDQLQLRGGTTTEHNSFTGAAREVTVDTTKKTLVVHDGSQAGGTPLMKESGATAASSVVLGTGGVERLKLSSTEVVVNETGTDTDFRIEGDTRTHLLFVDAGNQKVGIGAATPDSMLVVQDTSHTNFQVWSGSTSTKGFIQTVQDSDVRIGASTNHPVSFHNNGLERFRYDTSGRLLIGTSTNTFTGVGSSRLQVSGTGADTSGINLIRTSNDGGGAYLQFTKNRGSATQSGDNCGAIAWLGHDGTDVESYLAQIRVLAGATATSNSMTGNITFETANGSSIPSERMRLDSAGRLLIGTTTQGTTGADDLTINTSGTTGITIRSGTSSDGNLFFADGTSGNDTFRGFIQYEHTNNALRFGTNSTEALRINGSQNVGIGTSSPSSIFHVQRSGGTQFRFDDNYFYIKAPDGGNRFFFGETQNDKSAQFSLYNSSDQQKVRIAAGDGSGNGNTFFNGGNVGIGLTNPSSLLELSGGGNTALSINTGNNSGDNSTINFGDSDDGDVGYLNYDHGTNALQVGVSATQFASLGPSQTIDLFQNRNIYERKGSGTIAIADGANKAFTITGLGYGFAKVQLAFYGEGHFCNVEVTIGGLMAAGGTYYGATIIANSSSGSCDVAFGQNQTSYVITISNNVGNGGSLHGSALFTGSGGSAHPSLAVS